MDLPKRKHPRLKNYDYSSNGYYFITFCIENPKVTLSTVRRNFDRPTDGSVMVGRGLDPAVVTLTDYGKIVEEEILDVQDKYEIVKIDKYCIMPNHVHLIIIIDDYGVSAGSRPRPTVPDLMRIIKSKSARRFNQLDNTPGRKVFQTSYMDEIIGSVKYYQEVWRYIDENPIKWLITKQII